MMIHFQGHMMIMFFIIFFFLGAYSAMAARPHNSMVELSSTPDDLVRLIAGYGEEKLSTVVVGGTLHCDAYPVPGALMEVSCDNNGKTRKSNWVRGKTNEDGDFLIDLPSHLHAIPNMEKRCVVRIVHLPKKSACTHPRFAGKHKKIKLTSSLDGIRTYSTDEIHLMTHTRSRGRKAAQVL